MVAAECDPDSCDDSAVLDSAVEGGSNAESVDDAHSEAGSSVRGVASAGLAVIGVELEAIVFYVDGGGQKVVLEMSHFRPGLYRERCMERAETASIMTSIRIGHRFGYVSLAKQ